MRRNKFLFKTIFCLLIIFWVGITIFINFWLNPRSTWRQQPSWLTKLHYLTKLNDFFYLPWLLPQPSVPTYQLIIDPADFAKMINSLPPAYSDTVSSVSKKVPASFIANHQKYPVEVRIQITQNIDSHIAKKSWRIKFNQQPFENYSELDLLLPESRGFLVEPLSYQLAQEINLSFPNTWFAQLQVNGQLHGTYLVSDQDKLSAQFEPDQIISQYLTLSHNPWQAVQIYDKLWKNYRLAMVKDQVKPYSNLFITVNIWKYRRELIQQLSNVK